MSKLYDISGNNAGTDDDTLSLDYFTDQFGKKTQYAEFYEPKPEAEKPDDIPSELIDPDGDANADERPDTGIWKPESEEEREISPERFAKTGRNIARLIDTGFDFAMSNLVVKDSEKSYHASEKDIDDLAEAWSEIAEDKQWEMGPGWRLAVLYLIIYAPLTRQALNDRRIMELERRADETEQKQKDMENEIKYLKNELYRKTNGNAADNTAGVGVEG